MKTYQKTTPIPPSLPAIGKWRYFWTGLPCFIVGLFGWLRFAGALHDWYYLVELGVHPSPLTLALGGALWGVLGWAALALIGIRLRGDWNRPLVFLLALAAALAYWVDLLAFTRPAEMLGNLPFALVLTVLLLLYLFILLQLPRWWRSRMEVPDVK
jgi:hypothetical protein